MVLSSCVENRLYRKCKEIRFNFFSSNNKKWRMQSRWIFFRKINITDAFWDDKPPIWRGRRGGDRMVVWFTTTYAISAYHHWSCEFEPCSWWGVLDTTFRDKVYQWLVTGRWFSLGTPLSSTNKTDHHDITEILLEEAFNTITLTPSIIIGPSGTFSDW